MTPAEQLELAQADFFWLPKDATPVSRPEISYVHCPRPVLYLNNVFRVRAQPDQLPSLIQEVGAAHHPEVSQWHVGDVVDPAPLQRALQQHNYEPDQAHAAMVRDVSQSPRVPKPTVRVQRVDTLARLRDAIAVVETAFGLRTHSTDTELADELARLTAGDARVTRYVAYDGERPVGTGGLNLFGELGIGLLWGGSTIADARGRGVYRAVLDARMRHAHAAGLQLVGLYARRNSSAPIVARLGFSEVGQMQSWVRKPGTAP